VTNPLYGNNPAGRRSRSKGGSRPANGSRNQQIVDAFTTLKTASSMLDIASKRLDSTAGEMAKHSLANRTAIDDLANVIGNMVHPGYLGRNIGGTPTPGPIFGRVPGIGGYQNPRPSSWGAHGYPGGTGYGLGLQGYGGIGQQRGGLGGVRDLVARAVHTSFGTGNWGVREVTDPATGAKIGYEGYDQSTGQATTSQYQSRDDVHAEMQSSPQGIRSNFAGAMAGARTGRAALQGLAARGGALGEVAGTALKAVPYVGAAVAVADAAWKVGNFVADQRQANAQYQNIYGGTNINGMGQRFLQAGYGIGQILSGGMSWGQSQEAFKGISAMGYEGGSRQHRLDFVQDNYKSFGTSVSDSMAMVQIAANNFSSSLQDLHEQLGNVRDMATSTGQNFGAMTQKYIANLATTSEAGMGPAAAPLAAALTSAGPGWGRQFSDFSYSGMTSTMQQSYITSGYAGYTDPAALWGDSRQDPSIMGKAQDYRAQAMIMSAVPDSVRKYIEGQIKKFGGPGSFADPGSGGTGANLAMNIAGDPKVYRNVRTAQVITAMAQQFPGLNVTTIGKALPLVVEIIAQQMRGGMRRKTKQLDEKNKPITDPGKITEAEKDLGDGGGTGVDSKGVPRGRNEPGGSPGGGGHTGDKVSHAESIVHGHKQFDWPISKMIKDMGLDDGKVMVQTAEGMRTVSLRVATEKFRSQLADGTAIIISGGSKDNIGKKVGEQYGYEYRGKTPFKDSKKTSDVKDYEFGKAAKAISGMPNLGPAELHHLSEVREAFKKMGMSDKDLDKNTVKMAQDLVKDKNKETGKTIGSVSLYMQPQLEQWIGAAVDGNVTLETAVAGRPKKP
jgi:hypothetical protein